MSNWFHALLHVSDCHLVQCLRVVVYQVVKQLLKVSHEERAKQFKETHADGTAVLIIARLGT